MTISNDYNVYEHYINDLISTILEEIEDSATKKRDPNLKDEKDYYIGEVMGYYDVLTVMRMRSKVLGISIPSLEIDLEQFLG